MAKQANSTLIGAFVVGAVLLVLGGVVAFGSGYWLRDEFKYVAFFEQSVSGLDVGAPVRYRGVQVGTVSDIKAAWYSLEEETPRIPVELTFVAGAVKIPPELDRDTMDSYDFIEMLIAERGLKAELQQDSFVTGKLFVAMDFSPDIPMRRFGGTKLPEVPTTEGGLAKLRKSLEQLPIETLVEQAIDTMAAIEVLAQDPKISNVLTHLDRLATSLDREVGPLAAEAREAVAVIRELVTDPRIERLLTDASHLVAEVDARVTPLADSTRSAMVGAEETMRSLRTAVEDLRGVVKRVDGEVEATASSARGALGSADRLLEALDDVVEGDYALGQRLAVALEEIARAARSVRTLADYLERHPESLISGKE